jgi:alcohol dehydrogenase class IV
MATMNAFTYQGLPARVVFGTGTVAALPAEAERLGLSRLLVLCTPRQADLARKIASALGGRAAGIFADAAMHTPAEVTERALAQAAALGVDGVVAVGGGSTTGLGKAMAYRTDLPQIVLPTTFAGSEMTPILGETVNGLKTTLVSPRVLPELVIYDVELTLSVPASVAGVSGLNAIAHAVEALYARERNPVIGLLALEAVAALARSLPAISAAPADREARSDALYGAWLCGICLGSVGMALHHKLCHTLGGSFGLPHAETHAVMLPHTLAYNLPAIEAADRLAAALGASDAVDGLLALARRVHAPTSLGALGMPADGIERAAELAMANAYWNPRPLEVHAIRELIARAQRGDVPQRQWAA